MAVDSQLHNVRAMIVGATGEFAFAENAPSAALAGTADYPYIDFGNILGVDVTAKNETEKVIDCYRGVRSEISNTPTLVGMGYKVKSNEADPLKMAYALAGSKVGSFTQAVLAAVDADALAFSAQKPAIQNAWYTLSVGGAKVRNLTTVTIVGKVEGVDFVVDKELGRIRFLTAQVASLTPKVTAPAVTAGDLSRGMSIVKPADQPIRRGYGRLTFFDKDTVNKVVYDHYDFQCEIAPDSNPISSQDGKAVMEVSMMITVMRDRGLAAIRE